MTGIDLLTPLKGLYPNALGVGDKLVIAVKAEQFSKAELSIACILYGNSRVFKLVQEEKA